MLIFYWLFYDHFSVIDPVLSCFVYHEIRFVINILRP